MPCENDPTVRGLVKELAKEDEALVEAAQDLQRARTQFEVTSRKYAAVRDVVAKHMHCSPYTVNLIPYGAGRSAFLSNGRYRFIHMTPGDAAVAGLKESEEPMTLDEIVDKLKGGGFHVADPRSINAALMKTSRIQKTKDGRYRYEVDPDDLPFE
jgi:hypothetical protein